MSIFPEHGKIKVRSVLAPASIIALRTVPGAKIVAAQNADNGPSALDARRVVPTQRRVRPSGLFRRNLQGAGARYVLLAPPRKRAQNLSQGFPLFRQPIGVAHRMFLIRSFVDQARLF